MLHMSWILPVWPCGVEETDTSTDDEAAWFGASSANIEWKKPIETKSSLLSAFLMLGSACGLCQASTAAIYYAMFKFERLVR